MHATAWPCRTRPANRGHALVHATPALRAGIALEALNQRYALGDIDRTGYLQNRDDILAAQRSSQVAKSQAAHIFGEKVKSVWRTLPAPDERASASRSFPP
jgi:hypothetical protein